MANKSNHDKSTVSETAVSDELHAKNVALNPEVPATEGKDAENEVAAKKVEEHKKDAKEVDTKLGTSQEEKAAERAGVAKERLDNEKQNREPKNEFEKDNQKVTEAERKAAQKESDLSTEKRIEKADVPTEAAHKDAAKTAETNQSSDIAAAIKDGFKSSKDDSFELQADAGVEHRFSLVKNKDGDVMLRENETGHLSRLQLQSIEEKEASIQGQEVEEL